jgi:hypothetical protein
MGWLVSGGLPWLSLRGGEGLILSAGRHVQVDGQMSDVFGDFLLANRRQILCADVFHEPQHPLDVSLFGAARIVQDAELPLKQLDQQRLLAVDHAHELFAGLGGILCHTYLFAGGQFSELFSDVGQGRLGRLEDLIAIEIDRQHGLQALPRSPLASLELLEELDSRVVGEWDILGRVRFQEPGELLDPLGIPGSIVIAQISGVNRRS